MFIEKLFFMSLLLFTIENANSKTYYVDNMGGNDANSGISTTRAWKSFAKVVSQTFNTGDIVSFKCGDRFPVTESMTRTGKDEVTFNSYGTGSRPIIDAGGTCIPFDFVTITGANHITFNGLKIVNGNSSNISCWNCTFFTIESCNIDSAYDVPGHIDGANGTKCMNIYFGGDDLLSTHDLIIRNSTLSYAGGSHGIYIAGTNNVLLEYDSLNYNAHVGIRIAGGGSQYCANNITIRYCVIKYNHYSQIENSGASYSNFYYNIIATDTAYSIREHSAGGSGGIYFHDQSTEIGVPPYFYPHDCNYYNNTIINNRNHGWDIPAFVVETTSNMANIVIKNNLFYCEDGDQYMHLWYNGAGDGLISNSWVFTNNIYYAPGSAKHLFNRLGTNYSSLKAWNKATGYETNSKFANPLFTNYAAGDYSLSSRSPAINSGTFVGLTMDINSNAVPNPPDMGAFQHLPHQ
jgi:hypothetical protein